MNGEAFRDLGGGLPMLSFASPQSILPQLSLIRADLARHPLSVCHIQTSHYTSSKAEDIERLMKDIRAGRVEEFRIDEARWGARRIFINYFAR
jgi:hypothetical protein